VSAADPYSRCPDCPVHRAAGVDGLRAYRAAPDGDVYWSRPVHVPCMICHAHHDITAADVVQADAEMACKRCAGAVVCPAGAARVQCTGCGLFLLGQDLDDAQREELRITEGLAGLALRETYLAAKRRAEGRARL
jgi:hypothetical protein